MYHLYVSLGSEKANKSNVIRVLSLGNGAPYGKPAPDLCFYAAEKMNVSQKTCLVIEDSEMGILAAKAAGMEVWHFAGGSHVKAGYRLPEALSIAKVIPDMPSLLNTFVEIGISKRAI